MQTVSFVASCLMDSDIFGEKSARSILDFAQIFFDDISIVSSQFLREVMDELEKQNSCDEVSFLFYLIRNFLGNKFWFAAYIHKGEFEAF